MTAAKGCCGDGWQGTWECSRDASRVNNSPHTKHSRSEISGVTTMINTLPTRSSATVSRRLALQGSAILGSSTTAECTGTLTLYGQAEMRNCPFVPVAPLSLTPLTS